MFWESFQPLVCMGSPSSIRSLLIDSSIHSQHSLQSTQETYGSCRCQEMNDANTIWGGMGILWKTYIRQNYCSGLSIMQLNPLTADYILHTTSSKPFSSCTHLFIVCIFFFLLARTFGRNLCWGYRGHLVRAQDGELGRPV